MPDDQPIRRLYQQLQDKPLKPGDGRYEPIYSSGACEDPVSLLQRGIEFAEEESLQLFSGFRGSGKTTELFRLRKQLKEAGYVVLYADALEYVNPAEDIEIAELLLVLAGALSDCVESELGPDPSRESYWDRFRNFVSHTQVNVSEVAVKAEAANALRDVLGGVKAGMDIKLALRTTPSFRYGLREFLNGRIGEFKKQVDAFAEDCVKLIRARRGADTRIVFLFDSLEQLRGSAFNEDAVIRSVVQLFANHLGMLELPYLHAVYTVPPWLQFAMPGIAPIILLPCIRLWANDAARTRNEAGWAALRDLVRRRFGDAGFADSFPDAGPEGVSERADRLIGLCGGHFRDLLRLFREAVVRTNAFPVPDAAIDGAIAALRRQYLPIAVENARWLKRIADLRSCSLPNDQPENVQRLTRFLDTHFVLYFANGEEWYDVHPLVREEVERIVARNPLPPGPTAQ